MTYRQGEGLPDEPPPSIVETTTEARQGVTGHNVRYVLYWSLGGAVLIFALIYVVFSQVTRFTAGSPTRCRSAGCRG
jgi:hypothetical protein